MNFPILTICEGASEVNYIQLLNRVICSSDGRTVFVPRNANGGSPKKIISTLKRERNQNRKIATWIFLDEDIYSRDPSLKSALEEKKGNATLQFSRMNFEDTVMLHEPYEKLIEWIQICKNHRHFSDPLHEDEYLSLFKEHFPDYHKRELPFELTNSRLERAFENLKRQNDIKFSLLSSVEQLLTTREIVLR